MFDVPADVPYVWLGVATASAVALVAVVGLPSAAPPDATAAARAVDAVASGPTGSRGTFAVDARRMRIEAHQIGLEGPGGTAHASFAYGDVTPVGESGPLRRVLRGTPVDHVFASPGSFERAVDRAASRDPAWRRAPDRLTAHRVSWGDVRVTLVG